MSDNFINLSLKNIDSEHICCAISDKKHQEGVMIKKEWLKERINEGQVFRKLDANGKVFIEYAPIESAWASVEGKNYMYIYCLWVAGSYKSKGYGSKLLNYCIDDAKKKGKSGVCVITSKKKLPFLSEKKFFEKFGFKVVDEINEYQLLALSFDNTYPKFTENSKQLKIESKDITIFYSPQCPYTQNCIKELKEFSEQSKIKIVFEKVDTLKKAKEVPCVFNNWATFKDGNFISNTLLNENMLKKLI